MSWKCEVQVRNETGWHGNALRFPTEDQAQQYAANLFGRWLLVEQTRVVECLDPVRHVWLDGRVVDTFYETHKTSKGDQHEHQ